MILQSNFKPAWWLKGAHVQTFWPTLTRSPVELSVFRERIELPDGDFIDLDWGQQQSYGPLVLVLHGLEGSIHSPYAKGMLRALQNAGCRVVFMHFRGCSGEPNRLDRSYHSGETDDVAYIVSLLSKRYPLTPMAAVGYSLGGSVLLKWLGDTATDNPLRAAVAISVPFELNKVADRIRKGFSRVYQYNLMRNLKSKLANKYANKAAPFDLDYVKSLKSFWEFDDYITAPLHGFSNALHYYMHASCRSVLKDITVPTLAIHAIDDPFMTPDVIPDEKELGPGLTLELSPYGGHVGFVSGQSITKPVYWLEERVPAFMREILSQSEEKQSTEVNILSFAK